MRSYSAARLESLKLLAKDLKNSNEFSSEGDQYLLNLILVIIKSELEDRDTEQEVLEDEVKMDLLLYYADI